MHEDKCKYAHTMPFEWEAASSKNNPGFDTSLRFLPSKIDCSPSYKRQGESSSAGGPDQKRSLLEMHHFMKDTNHQIQLGRMRKGGEAMKALEDAKHRKAGPMELAEKVDEVRKHIPHAFSVTLQDKLKISLELQEYNDKPLSKKLEGEVEEEVKRAKERGLNPYTGVREFVALWSEWLLATRGQIAKMQFLEEAQRYSMRGAWSDGRDPDVNEAQMWNLFQQEHSHWYERVEIPRLADPEPGPQMFHEEAMLKAKGARKALEAAVKDATPPELDHPAPQLPPKEKPVVFGRPM